MGTVRINPVNVSFSNAWTLSGGSAPDILSQTVAGIVSQSRPFQETLCPGPGTQFDLSYPTPGISRIDCSGTGFDVLLDGNPTNILSLPSGFHYGGGSIYFKYQPTQYNTGSNWNINYVRVLYNDAEIYRRNNGSVGSIVVDTNASFSTDNNYLTMFGSKWGIELLTYKNITISTACGDFTYSPEAFDMHFFYFSGQYDIISTHWVLTNLTHPSLVKQALPGDQMKLTSDPPIYDFSTVDSIIINDTPITVFDEQTAVFIKFTIPSIPPQGPVPISITNPTTFTGTAYVDSWTILLASASGIYQISSGKTHDTLYLSAGENNSTENVAIPNPFVKTGFIGA